MKNGPACADRKLTRRDFLRLSAMTTAGIVAAACARATPQVVEKEKVVTEEVPVEKVVKETVEVEKVKEVEKEVEKVVTATPLPAGPVKYKEAPELAEKVEAGELPPVDERLPLEPFVVGPGVLIVEEDLDWVVGEYSREGEVLRSVTNVPEWSYPCQHGTNEWFLNTPEHHTAPITGDLCKSWKVNEDLTEYEFTLRKGLKWSDGEPVTTEDIRFTWEDVRMNEEITPVLSHRLRTAGKPGGKPLRLEIVDDFTFKVTFPEPTGRFLETMGMGNLWTGCSHLLLPKHYLKQFHTKYTPIEDLKPLLEEEGLGEDEWYRLFHAKTFWGGGCPHEAEGFPVVYPWVVKESPEDLIIMERNPYYFKVDIEGNQLPYVNRIESVVVSTAESIPAKIVGCECNYERERLHHEDISLYKAHEDECGYRVNLDMVYHNAPVALFLNLNNLDPVWREVAWKKEFRHAVNAAINNLEILDVIYLGMGKPCPWIPNVDDPEEANRLLDEIGLDKRDAEGWRLGPDGKRFEFHMDVRQDPLYVQPAELIRAHLEEVGLHVTMKAIGEGLWGELRGSNELYAAIDWVDDCNWPYIKMDYTPPHRIRWAQCWQKWMVTGGEKGEEPPDWMKELYEIDAELGAVNPNKAGGEEAEKRFAEWFKEYIPFFPLTRDVIDPVIVPANGGNIPHSGRSSAMMFAGEQVFFKH